MLKNMTAQNDAAVGVVKSRLPEKEVFGCGVDRGCSFMCHSITRICRQ